MLVEAGLTAAMVEFTFCAPRLAVASFRTHQTVFWSIWQAVSNCASPFRESPWCYCVLPCFPLVPIPLPFLPDDFSFLLASDALASGRITKSDSADVHSLREHPHHDEYHVHLNVFPAQSLVMAAGKVVFGRPWFGILLSSDLFCSALCSMRRRGGPPPGPCSGPCSRHRKTRSVQWVDGRIRRRRYDRGSWRGAGPGRVSAIHAHAARSGGHASRGGHRLLLLQPALSRHVPLYAASGGFCSMVYTANPIRSVNWPCDPALCQSCCWSPPVLRWPTITTAPSVTPGRCLTPVIGMPTPFFPITCGSMQTPSRNCIVTPRCATSIVKTG